MFSFIDWMQQMDEQEEKSISNWNASHGFPMGARSYWVVDQKGNRIGESILFYKGDGRIFARLLVTVQMQEVQLKQLLQALYDQFDYFNNLECTVWHAQDLGTYETLKKN